jgi:hypothetical protein
MLRRDIRLWNKEVAARTILSVTALLAPSRGGKPSPRTPIGEEQFREIRNSQIAEIADQRHADDGWNTEEGGRGQQGREAAR